MNKIFKANTFKISRTFHEHGNPGARTAPHVTLLVWHAGVFGVTNPRRRTVPHSV